MVLEYEWSRHITAAVCTGDEELCGVVDQTKGDDQSRPSQQRGYSADTPALSRIAPSQCSVPELNSKLSVRSPFVE